ncbi:hypothetical protein KGF86_15010 [Ornithinibacillus massiliensis]|uniref:Yip1 domain-containing protein n=1 Tax=Ornithinibacillus massiliensis TaxID=1944633 RepID=A0ABS5MGS5_9BACI|nr:hypothetical protein [Ornithinibacillus massiliensis]MBS3681510.1 hypothetical protein [Ornithinibacillus massiliensis]
MKCEHCDHESGTGALCVHCGSPLEKNEDYNDRLTEELPEEKVDSTSKEETIPSQATNLVTPSEGEATGTYHAQEKETHQTTENKNDFADQLGSIFTNFGYFFMTLVKKPSMARKANHKDKYSALITLVAIALFISLSTFIPMAIYSRNSFFMPAPSMFYGFLVPLFLYILLFAGFIGITFAAAKLIKLNLSFLDVLGKYGAYILPYGLLYVSGSILLIVQMPIIPVLLLAIGVVGSIFVVPVLILWEKEGDGFDKIYTLLGLYVSELLLIVLFSNSLFGSIMRELFYFLP